MLGVIQQPLSEAFEVSEVMRVYTLPTLIIPVEFLSDSSARHDISDLYSGHELPLYRLGSNSPLKRK